MIPLAPFHFLIFYIAVTAIYKQAARHFSSQAINSSLAREYIVFRDLGFVLSAQSFLPTANLEFIICGEQSGQPEGWRVYISVSFFSFLGTQTQNETLQFSKLTPISFYPFSSLPLHNLLSPPLSLHPCLSFSPSCLSVLSLFPEWEHFSLSSHSLLMILIFFRSASNY